jgi:K+-sensing histidine kinase KdpD
VRTPLATIRTLIRSLLRRQELSPVVRQRLEQIDGECTEQIDRFGLIFLAAEQQRQSGGGQPLADTELARTDLSELLRQLEDFWRRQLDRRGLRLELAIAPDLPPVLSDPSKLETMLGGLMDRFSRSLPSGAEVRMSLMPAGSRLKLRINSVGPEVGPGSGDAGTPGPGRGGAGARTGGTGAELEPGNRQPAAEPPGHPEAVSPPGGAPDRTGRQQPDCVLPRLLRRCRIC